MKVSGKWRAGRPGKFTLPQNAWRRDAGVHDFVDDFEAAATPKSAARKWIEPVAPAGSLGRRPPARPQNSKTSVTVSSEPSEIRRSTPCPFQEICHSVLSWCLIVALRPWIRAPPTMGAAAAGDDGPAGALISGWRHLRGVSSDTRRKVASVGYQVSAQDPTRLEVFRARVVPRAQDQLKEYHHA
jgi:hypothetical protein